MKRKILLLIMIFCSLMLQLSFAQYLNVHLNSGNINQYIINDVKTITFAGNDMEINKTNSTTETKLLGDIRKIIFSDTFLSAPVVANESDETITVFPNPAKTNFTVTVTGETRQIKIFNAFGQIVNTVNTNGQKIMDLEIQVDGIYFLQFITDKLTITKKIIIVK